MPCSTLNLPTALFEERQTIAAKALNPLPKNKIGHAEIHIGHELNHIGHELNHIGHEFFHKGHAENDQREADDDGRKKPRLCL